MGFHTRHKPRRSYAAVAGRSAGERFRAAMATDAGKCRHCGFALKDKGVVVHDQATCPAKP